MSNFNKLRFATKKQEESYVNELPTQRENASFYYFFLPRGRSEVKVFGWVAVKADEVREGRPNW